MILKKFLAILLLAFLAGQSSCMIPLASKNYLAYDAQSQGTRVSHSAEGTLLILSFIPVGSSMDAKVQIDRMKESKGCKDLKNIDLQYYQTSFYFFGWEKMVIYADCVK